MNDSDKYSIENFLFDSMEQAAVLLSTLDHICRKYEITPQQWFVLQLLKRSPKQGMMVSQIGNKMHVTKGNVTGILNRMEKKDLIERIGSQRDRRIIYIKMTLRGQNILTGISKYISAKEQQYPNKMLVPMLAESSSTTIESIKAILNENKQQTIKTTKT